MISIWSSQIWACPSPPSGNTTTRAASFVPVGMGCQHNLGKYKPAGQIVEVVRDCQSYCQCMEALHSNGWSGSYKYIPVPMHLRLRWFVQSHVPRLWSNLRVIGDLLYESFGRQECDFPLGRKEEVQVRMKIGCYAVELFES